MEKASTVSYCGLSGRPCLGNLTPYSRRFECSNFKFTCRRPSFNEGNGNKSECQVYVANMRLRVPAGPPSWLLTALEAMDVKELQHYMTIVQPSSGEPCTVFDFQPQNSEDIFVVLAALSGQSVPGLTQKRMLKKLPTQKCSWIGKTLPRMGVENAIQYNKSYNPQLLLGKNDCRQHTLGLVEFLTGKKLKLYQLPLITKGKHGGQLHLD